MPSRLTSDRWADPEVDSPAEIDVLIPTAGRAAELAVTLAGLAAQDDPPFRVIISDQSDEAPGTEHPAVEAMIRVLRAQGRTVEVHRHLWPSNDSSCSGVRAPRLCSISMTTSGSSRASSSG
jgi:hypothetical protein